MSERLIEKGEFLGGYYVPTRYPNAWPWGAPHRHYTREDAERALGHAGEVVEFVKKEIGRDP